MFIVLGAVQGPGGCKGLNGEKLASSQPGFCPPPKKNLGDSSSFTMNGVTLPWIELLQFWGPPRLRSPAEGADGSCSQEGLWRFILWVHCALSQIGSHSCYGHLLFGLMQHVLLGAALGDHPEVIACLECNGVQNVTPLLRELHWLFFWSDRRWWLLPLKPYIT